MILDGRGVINGNFLGLATIFHLAYNSKNKKDDFSWSLISNKLYTFSHFGGILMYLKFWTFIWTKFTKN